LVYNAEFTAPQPASDDDMMVQLECTGVHLPEKQGKKDAKEANKESADVFMYYCHAAVRPIGSPTRQRKNDVVG
jgi:hypothetical protein